MGKYIDKAAVVAEIERKIEAHKETLKNCDSSISEMVLKSSMSAYQSLLHFLNTLEVKEVDLWTEFGNFIEHYRNRETGYTDFTVAEYFFELGLKAQKGE